jgi:hypothetical protein
MTSVAARGAMGVVWRFALATTLVVLAFSMTGPVLAVSLQKAGASTAAVGLFAMVSFLMIGLLIPVTPRVLARWGVVRTYRAGSTPPPTTGCRGPSARPSAAWGRRACGTPPKRCWRAKRRPTSAAA